VESAGRAGQELRSVCIQVNTHKLAGAGFWLYSLSATLYHIILLSKCNIPTINEQERVWISLCIFSPSD